MFVNVIRISSAEYDDRRARRDTVCMFCGQIQAHGDSQCGLCNGVELHLFTEAVLIGIVEVDDSLEVA